MILSNTVTYNRDLNSGRNFQQRGGLPHGDRPPEIIFNHVRVDVITGDGRACLALVLCFKGLPEEDSIKRHLCISMQSTDTLISYHKQQQWNRDLGMRPVFTSMYIPYLNNYITHKGWSHSHISLHTYPFQVIKMRSCYIHLNKNSCSGK